MNPAILQSPFIQTALPIMFTILIVVWAQNKAYDAINRRLDDMNKRIDEVIKRLDRIESKLDDHERRIVRVEERTSPVARG
jgi:tetrahydromethanopterin S-methyltransferase subunit G